MRFDGIRFSGLGPFKGLVDVDLSAIQGRLVAIVGGNGEGKSTFLELLPGSLYRETPTRGSLASLATSRDAFVETRFVNGSPWTLHHSVDSVSGGGDSLVLDANGKPEFDSAKRRAFDTWAAKHLPSKEVLYASTFAAQKSGGFLELKAGDRKAVLLRAIGVERLEGLAERARKNAGNVRTSIVRLRAQLEEIGEADTALAADALQAAEAAVAGAVAELQRAKAVEERGRAYAAVAPRFAPLERRLADLRERRANNAMILGDAEKIRFALDGVEGAQATLRSLEAELARAERLVSEATATASASSRLRDAAEVRHRRILQTLGEAEEALKTRAVVDKAVADVQRLRAEVEDIDSDFAKQRSVLDSLRAELATKSSGRIEGLRTGLQGILATTRADSKVRAKSTLDVDDAAAELIVTAPAEIEKGLATSRELGLKLAKARQDLAIAEHAAARGSVIEQAERQLAVYGEELARSQAERSKLQAERDVAQRDIAVAQACVKSVQDLLATARPAAEQLAMLARRGPALEKAQERIAELDPQILDAETELQQLRTVPVEDDRDYVTPAETALAACRARRERAALALEQATADADRRAGVQAELAAAEEELADWMRLGDDLGRGGLQEAEIDCAAPELTELTNDLLHNCHGPRWTVSVEAQRLSADGKHELSGMEISVLDTKAGREAEAKTYSGGECVMLGEAFSLALTMVACRRAGAVHPTLVRDESGAALSPENSRVWVAMLRRAAELLDVSHILFVSHNPEVAALADARIVVADGGVTVQ